ncbi:MAG: murein hydrolase activator EnvC family protein [Desulfocucumaceae bacterium]
MTTRRYKLICIAVLAGITLLASSFSFAAVSELEEKQQELQEIEQLINKYEKLYAEKKKEENQTLQQIKLLEGNINGLENEIGTLKEKLDVTETEITVAKEEISFASDMVDERTEYFNRRLKQIYQNGDVSYLEVLVQASSLTDFLTRLDYLKKIAENDTKLLAELETVRKELVLKKELLEEKAEHFNNLKSQKETKQGQLETQSTQKTAYLKNVQEQKEEYTKALQELEDSRKLIDQFIKEWQEKNQKGYMGSGGLMQWPVPGYKVITSSFGSRIHPIYKIRSFHSAIDIKAPAGTPVVAAENGIVVFMGNKVAYGNAIILDHGGGISTQYSHLSRFAPSTQVGGAVKRGQVIGYVGSTGWSTGAHLDFIVRLKGEPQDPTRYVRP